MYTQCPECQIAFRVTVKVLQKAGGRVRCGGCGIAFSAIEHLSEELPANETDQPKADVDEKTANIQEDGFDVRNEELLKTLEELAGPEDVRIEDTGVEWRVLDDANETEEVDEPAVSNERRYDDNTPLPDNFEDENKLVEPRLTDTAPSEFQSTDPAADDTERDTHQVEMALANDDDWTGLLEDYPDTATDDDEQAAQADPELTTPDDLDLQFNLQAEAMGLDIAAKEDLDLTAEADLEMEGYADSEALDACASMGIDEYPADEAEQSGEDSDISFVDEEQLSGEDNDAFPGDEAQLPSDDSDTSSVDEEQLSGEDDEELPTVDSDTYAVDEDELSPEEEADIVKKLRDSTGSFQKQIEAAQRALEQGDIDVYEESEPVPQTQDVDDADTIEARIALTPENRDSLDETRSPGPPVEPAREEVDLLSQTMIQAGIDPSQMDAENIETIVMEGNFVFDSAGSDTNPENDLGTPASLVDTYMLNKQQLRGGRRKSDPSGFGVIAGVVVLVVVLLAQYIHASRQTFATYGAFNQTLGPVYRALGKPVTPQWNIKGWQFETTSGSTDENEAVLTVSSTIRNTSDKPLPYPLVHVSLTDRWEEIIGSKVLGPSEYLAGDLDPRQAVPSGEAFTAVIAIKEPSPEATGFQLYACYRTSPGQMRCATEDFKN